MADRKQTPARPFEIEYIAIGDLLPDPGNVRKHSKKQIMKLEAGMREFGCVSPILIDENNLIIAGHARVEAAARVPLERVPCVRITGLNENKKKALAIADNKLGDMSWFDIEGLTITLAQLDSVSCVELTGFDTPELDILLDLQSADQHKPADPADDAPTVLCNN